MKRFVLLFIGIFLLLTSCSMSYEINRNPLLYHYEIIDSESSVAPSEEILFATTLDDAIIEKTINDTVIALPVLPSEELNNCLYSEISEHLSAIESPFLPFTVDFVSSENFDTKTYTFFISDSVESLKKTKFFFSYDTIKNTKKTIEDFMSKKSFNEYMKASYKIQNFTSNFEIDAIEVVSNGINIYSDNTSYFVSSSSFDKERRFSVFSPDKYSPVVNPNEKYVALTFDDGPNPNTTSKLLETLKKHDVRATFFMVGYNIEEYPYLVKKVYSDGHDIGIHSYGHTNYSLLPFDQVLEDLDKCANLIYSSIGKRPYLVRPPFGAINEDEIKTSDYFFVNWNVDPYDWKLDSAEEIAKEAIKYTRSGSIILLHDIYSVSCDAVDIIITDLKKKGYRFVTISEYFDLNGKKSDNKLHFFLEDYNVEEN